MRRFAVILSLAVLAGSCRGSGKKDEQYKTEKADRGNITQTVTATGTLSAVTTVQVGSQVSGVISRLYADFNSRVKKGQLLAELDPTPFQQQVEQRQADVLKARVEATVHAKNVTVEGKLTGDVSADDRVELVASATVDGNIKAPKIVVAEGARFRGAVDMGSARPRDAISHETKTK